MITEALTLVHTARDRRRVVNTSDIYYLEATGAHTRVHRRGGRPLMDLRSLGDVLTAWTDRGLLRIHDGYAVHPARVLELRLRESGRDWELKLEPPVNEVLPIGRSYARAVWAAFGEG